MVFIEQYESNLSSKKSSPFVFKRTEYVSSLPEGGDKKIDESLLRDIATNCTAKILRTIHWWDFTDRNPITEYNFTEPLDILYESQLLKLYYDGKKVFDYSDDVRTNSWSWYELYDREPALYSRNSHSFVEQYVQQKIVGIKPKSNVSKQEIDFLKQKSKRKFRPMKRTAR